MGKLKNIIFKVKLKGQGIVNFDSGQQKFVNRALGLNNLFSPHDNVSYAKKKYSRDINGDASYKISISSNCLRHDIFKDDVLLQSPNVTHNKALLYSFLATPASLLRGYLFAERSDDTLKRKSPICIVDAIQTCDSISTLEFHSKSGFKNNDKESEEGDTTIFSKESIGEIEYATEGNIDLMQLQFLSADPVFDRYGINPDHFEIYKQFLKTRLPSFNSELGYYTINNSIIQVPEFGVKFENESITQLVKEFFTRLMKLNIIRTGAYARVVDVEFKLVYNVLEDTFSNPNDWVTLTDEVIENLDLNVHDFYVKEDDSEAKKIRVDILEALASKKLSKKVEVAEKAKNKKTNTEKNG